MLSTGTLSVPRSSIGNEVYTAFYNDGASREEKFKEKRKKLEKQKVNSPTPSLTLCLCAAPCASASAERPGKLEFSGAALRNLRLSPAVCRLSGSPRLH